MASVDAIAQLIETAPDRLKERLKRMQASLYSIVAAYVGQLDTLDGIVQQTATNYELLAGLRDELKDLLITDEYAGALRDYFSDLDKAYLASAEIVAQETQRTPEEIQASPALNAQNELNEGTIASVFLGEGYDQAVLTPIYEQVNDAVTGRGEYGALLAGIGAIMIGDPIRQTQGAVEHLASVNGTDLFGTTARAYLDNASSIAGVEFYKYVGGTVRDTRKFCAVRNGNTYHEAEVKAWVTEKGTPKPSRDWQGKSKGTTENNIFSRCGGYNCMHTLSPQSTLNVPEEVLRRNYEAGNWRPGGRERELLVEQRGLDWLK